jgi:predicted RNase H-like HicB family nuclease
MKELIFEVKEDLEGGYAASALGVGIHTQGETIEELKEMVRDAVDCYYDKGEEKPAMIRLHFVRDEVMAV